MQHNAYVLINIYGIEKELKGKLIKIYDSGNNL